jgi:hypothetical protein
VYLPKWLFNNESEGDRANAFAEKVELVMDESPSYSTELWGIVNRMLKDSDIRPGLESFLNENICWLDGEYETISKLGGGSFGTISSVKSIFDNSLAVKKKVP